MLEAWFLKRFSSQIIIKDSVFFKEKYTVTDNKPTNKLIVPQISVDVSMNVPVG